MLAEQPELDWEEFFALWSEDNTTGSQELACTGTSCEVSFV